MRAPGTGFKNGLLALYLGTTNNLGSNPPPPPPPPLFSFTCPIETARQCVTR